MPMLVASAALAPTVPLPRPPHGRWSPGVAGAAGLGEETGDETGDEAEEAEKAVGGEGGEGGEGGAEAMDEGARSHEGDQGGRSQQEEEEEEEEAEEEEGSQEDEMLRQYFVHGGATGSPQLRGGQGGGQGGGRGCGRGSASNAKRSPPAGLAVPPSRRGPGTACGARGSGEGAGGSGEATQSGEDDDLFRSPVEAVVEAGVEAGWVAGRGAEAADGARGVAGPAVALAQGSAQGWAKRPRDTKRGDEGGEARWLEGRGELAERFGAPPFSVLDARKGYWTNRREYWLHRYQIRSEQGRGDNLLGYAGLGGAASKGTSVFCPVLCELMYRWFCPAAGAVLDPFAGGSVRGCVAARLGLRYAGVELSGTQVAENRQQAIHMGQLAAEAQAHWQPPVWLHADARELPTLESLPTQSDFLFSCPPYYDLEVYSDDRRDLSLAADYAAFLAAYTEIIGAALRRLATNRFACFVVGEIRDGEGLMRNFVGDTISAFLACGAKLYNHAIMMLPLNTLPMRAPAALKATAKLGMCHQHVLVFYKGRAPTKDKVQAMGLRNAQKPLEWR